MNLVTTVYGDVKDLNFSIAILPWGATEPHNYHLPYCTDILIPQKMAINASSVVLAKFGIHAMVLPPVPFGSQNPGQWDLPFCIHTRYETQKAILTDIVTSLSRQGIYKLIIANGHGGNSFKNMFRDMAFDFPKFTIVSTDWFAIVPQKDFFEYPDDHAGEMETSVMMHYYPELIDLSKAGDGASNPFAMSSLKNKTAWLPRDWSKVSVDSGIGNPKSATASKGEQCARWYEEKLVTLIKELCTDSIY